MVAYLFDDLLAFHAKMNVAVFVTIDAHLIFIIFSNQ